MKLEAVIVPHIDLQALSKCVDLTETDKCSSRPHEKLSHVAASLFSLSPIKQWLHITFYFELPCQVVDFIINTNFLKVAFNFKERTSEGFISGSLADYESFVNFSLQPDEHKALRLVGNLMFNYFNTHYQLFSNREILHRPDKTFVLK